jgi:dTDP-4-dehydrorhamnose 3,5-epimerase
VHIRPLFVPDAFEITPVQHGDDRGVFLEWFRHDLFEAETGHRFSLAQANCSVSRQGVVRGIHYADVPPGQSKYVTCLAGSVLDVVIDLRVGSPTFGQLDSVVLDSVDRRAVYLAEGLGHAFMALSEEATVTYLCSTTYSPSREHGIHPLDGALGLPWPVGLVPLVSEKDAVAPTLAQAERAGVLPRYDRCQGWYETRTA